MTEKLITSLYTDPETGQAIATHSMMKTFRRCPKQAEYKYIQRLKPLILGKPLRQGTWMHKLLEIHYSGGDWREAHRLLTLEFNKLFDEEKDEIGDLPKECAHLMRSYLWHYKGDNWKVHETEFILECEFPNGFIYRAKIDALVEDQYGLWIADHKWNKSLPRLDFRILDAQSALYIWAALKNKIPVQGHIWNYGRRKVPTIPELTQSGRLSRRRIDTDYPTMRGAIKAYGLSLQHYQDELDRLYRQRFRHGEPQTSPFFRRDVLEKKPDMLKQAAREAYHTARRMHEYEFDRPEFIERVPDRSCGYMCSYVDLCTLELFGGDTRTLRKQKYREADPLDYYYDEAQAGERGDE